MAGANGILIDSTFTGNTASIWGGAVLCQLTESMANCSFVNSKSQQSNGIYAVSNLTINGGKGIVYTIIQGNLSGISIVVLNNETYYYPPNTNINLIKYR